MSRWAGSLALQIAADHNEQARPKAKGTTLDANSWHVVTSNGDAAREREIERFLARVPKVKPNECAIWQGSYLRLKQRSPQARFQLRDQNGKRGKFVLASRYAWELVHGPIPKGGKLYRRCFDNRCVNVRHLWLGTQKDMSAYLAGMGFLPAKHERSIGNGPTQRKARALCERILTDLAELRRMHARTYNAFRKTLRKPLPRNAITEAWRKQMRETARQRSTPRSISRSSSY